MRRIIWIVFLLIIALLALWFIVKTGRSVFSYFQLTAQLPVTVEKWTIKEIKSDRFAVMAHYSFEYQGKNYQGSGQVGGLYPNPWAATRAEQQFSSTQQHVWFSPKHPDHSVLEKKFPLKKVLSAAMLIGLFIYFCILSTYVRLKHK